MLPQSKVLYVFVAPISYHTIKVAFGRETVNVPMFNVAGCQWQDTLSWIIGRLSVHSLLPSPPGGKTRRHRFFKTFHRRFQLKTSAFYSAVLSIQATTRPDRNWKPKAWGGLRFPPFASWLVSFTRFWGGVITRDFTTARHRGWTKQLFSPKLKKFILKWIND